MFFLSNYSFLPCYCPCSTCCSLPLEKHADFLPGSSSYFQSPLLAYFVACIFELMMVIFLQTRKVFPTGFYAAIRYCSDFFLASLIENSLRGVSLYDFCYLKWQCCNVLLLLLRGIVWGKSTTQEVERVYCWGILTRI